MPFFRKLFVILHPNVTEIFIAMKTNRIILYFLLVLLAVSASSCVTPKNVRYLQDMPKDGMPINESLEATVAPYDDLRIYVLSSSAGKDDELLKPFNAVQSLGAGGAGSNTRLSGYLVDSKGNIQSPVLGTLHVEGLTRLQLQDTIAAQLIRNGQLKDPLVIVRFLNFKVFFLTSSGGKVLNVTDERCTFLEALAMAGGLDWYTRRDRIGVMREVEGKRVIHYLDPRSTDIFNDEFFVLQQNDIIFTEERPYKFFNANLNTVLGFISSITGLVTSAVSVVTLYKLFENWSW